jgi:hypothetical protein
MKGATSPAAAHLPNTCGMLNAAGPSMCKVAVLQTGALLTSLISTACAAHRIPAVEGDANEPRVGWVIMHGHQDNPDEEFGCQSNPRSDCAVDVSGSSGQTFAEVHLYFHPTQTETNYSGSLRVGFFRDTSASPSKLAPVTVKPGNVANYSVIGLVTDRPGRYTLTLDITGVSQSGVTQHIQEEVTVDVQPEPTAGG